MNETTGALANFFEGFALSLGIVLAVAVCCSLVGRIFLNRYERALRVRLEELEHLQTTTLPSYRREEVIQSSELVTGSAVFAVDYLQQLVAVLRMLIGGAIPSYERLICTTRDEALARLQEEANGCGAGAVVNVRFETSRVSLRSNPGCIEVLAHGTALIFKESEGRRSRFLREEGIE